MAGSTPSSRSRARYVREYLLLPLLGAAAVVVALESFRAFPDVFVPAWDAMPPWALLLNIVSLWMVSVFVSAITCRPRLAWLATVDAYCLLFLLHHWKLHHVETPLMVTDAFGWMNALSAALRYLSWADAGLLAFLVAVPFATLAFPVIFPPFPGTRWFHIGLTLFAGLFLSTFAMPSETWDPWLARYGRELRPGDPTRETREQGLLLTNALSFRWVALGSPSPYNAQAIATVLAPFREPAAMPTEEPIDVVLYLIEGFADPTRWKVKLSEDPLPSFRGYAAAQSSGSVTLPVTGEDTGQMEFELLTGMSTALLPTPFVPYQRYVHRNLDAIPRVFARFGYRAVAIQPTLPKALSRATVFPMLGFTEFRAWETFRGQSATPAAVTDDQVVDQVLQELDPASAHFTVATTAVGKPFADPAVGPLVLEAPPEAKASLEAYVQGLRRSDGALARLLESLKARPRRTMVVVMGTRVPAIAGLGKWISEDPDERYRSPLLVWTNYERPREEWNGSVTFLGAKILEWSSVPSTPLFRFEAAASAKIAALRPGLLRDRAGVAHSPGPDKWQGGTSDISPWIRSLWLLQYDQMFGAGYATPPPEDVAARLPPAPTAPGIRVVTSEEPPSPTPTPTAPPSPTPTELPKKKKK